MARTLLPFIVVALAIATSYAGAEPLPAPGFALDRTRSDPDRPVRATGGAYEGPIHDTHVHLDPPNRKQQGDLDAIPAVAKKSGVTRLTVMATPNEGRMGPDSEGAKLRLGLRDKGAGSGVDVRLMCGSEYLTVWMNDAHRGKNAAEADTRINRLERELDSGNCVGIGEIGLTHFTKWGHQAVIDFPATFPPFSRIADAAAERGLWLDLHAEPVEPEGPSREDEVFGAVALLVARNPGLKLILSHTAMTNPVNARRLLETYPGLMFNFKLVRDHSKWRNLEPVCDESGALYEDWATLMEAMPERFMVGTDAKFNRRDFPARKYRREIKAIRAALGSLNAEAARQIAWQTPNRVFGDTVP